MSKGTYRIVICVDVDASSVADAYGQVSNGLAGVDLEWESSDEWFDHNGDPVDVETVQSVRMGFMSERS